MAKETNDNSFDPDRIKLTEAFGPILSRLKDLDNDIRRLVPDHNTTGVLDNLSTVFLSIVPEKSLPFVGSCIERIEKSIRVFEENRDNIKSILKEKNPEKIFASKEEKEETNKLPDQVIEGFESEMRSYLDCFQQISSELKDRIDSIGDSRSVDKLPINLNTDELAALLELLQKVNVIPILPNTQLATIVSLHFSTKGANTLSKANFAKKLSDKNKSFLKIEKILKDMLKACRQE